MSPGERGCSVDEYRAGCEERSCHTPCAVRAAPAAEVVAVDPDQVFLHTSAFVCVWIRAGARRDGRLQCSLAQKVNSYSWVPENIFPRSPRDQVTNSASPDLAGWAYFRLGNAMLSTLIRAGLPTTRRRRASYPFSVAFQPFSMKVCLATAALSTARWNMSCPSWSSTEKAWIRTPFSQRAEAIWLGSPERSAIRSSNCFTCGTTSITPLKEGS